MAVTTKHGKRRMCERAGITSGCAAKMASRILKNGFRHTDTIGDLRGYLGHCWAKHHNSNNMRVYGDKLYIYTGERLITVLNIPQNIMQQGMKANLTPEAYQRYVIRRAQKGKAA